MSYFKRKLNWFIENNSSDEDIKNYFTILNGDQVLTGVPLKIKNEEEVKIIIRQSQSPGDILTLTAAVRDIKKQFPHIRMCLKTSCGGIWDNNPYVEQFEDDEVDLDLYANYPLVNRTNQCGKHMIHGFNEFLGGELGINILMEEFKCDVHLSEDERSWTNQVTEEFGFVDKFWIINSGSKDDYPLKQWPKVKWQEVVDKLQGKIQFVQVGKEEHNHEPMDNVLNLLGKTDLRQLIRLVYNSEGCVGHVSMLNHLCSSWSKPSVVVAGGRETATWEAYNTTQYLHVIGKYECCWGGGCWKSKAEDCLIMDDNDYPRCMNDISSDDVVSAINKFVK